MSIGSMSGVQAATLALISPFVSASASGSGGSGDIGLIANVEAAAGGVSAALQSISSALGSVIDVTA